MSKSGSPPDSLKFPEVLIFLAGGGSILGSWYVTEGLCQFLCALCS